VNAQDRGRTIFNSLEEKSNSEDGAAKSAVLDPELVVLINRWKNLPAVIKSAILAIACQEPADK
jgi:hypothetical protein